MLLKKLIKKLPSLKKKIEIRGLSINSKKVKKGFIFFAIKGNKINGEKFIDEAVKKGAAVIICSRNCKYLNKKVLVIKTSNIRNLLSEISSKFFHLKPKNIIAVTGTNGKTSVADLFYQILSLNKVPVASIGTFGIKYKDKIIKSNLTSPNTILLHQFLERLKKDKIENVIIEASSHGLHQNRINNLNLKAGIFTNFSHDHLDYHKTMKAYLRAKLILFKKILPQRGIIISDKSIKEFPILKNISKKRNLRFIDINSIFQKLNENFDLSLNKFQLKNLSMAIAAATICKLKENKIYKIINKIKDVDGRLELVKTFSNNIKVFIDYAHTPDALEKSIKSLKNSFGENISVVFGCGGNRDFKKRPLMAKIASANCKKIYITDDNPRNENPAKIRKQIIQNIKIKNNCFNIGNRAKAIKTAIMNADPEEIILIAGKGHEAEQIYKNKIISISDKQIVKRMKFRIKRLSSMTKNFNQNKKILKELTNRLKKIQNFHGFSIDTRTLKKDYLFLTVKGKNSDGSKFIPNALSKGAKYIISSKNFKKNKNKIIKVNNEINFLNRFASKKREYSKAKIFAITGSAGKTSLKNLIKSLLDNYGKTHCSPKSYNNHLGVPLSLTQLKTDDEYAVFELGMSKGGEINKLSKLVRPHIAIITNIGEAHIENFKNLKGIANAKSEILNGIKQNGTVILNRDDNFFHYLEKKAKLKNLKILSFGRNKKSDIHLISVTKRKNEKILRIRIGEQILNIELKDINIYNVLSSLALLYELNLDISKIKNFFKICLPSEGRGKAYNVKRYNKKFKLIDESYNANPLSVKNAINNLNSIKKNNFKKYLLLGDMLELGQKSKILHKNLSKIINSSDIDKVFIKGSEALVTYKNIHKSKRGNIFQQAEDVDFTLNNIIANNDYLMIKGSNATGLNNLSKRMIKGY